MNIDRGKAAESNVAKMFPVSLSLSPSAAAPVNGRGTIPRMPSFSFSAKPPKSKPKPQKPIVVSYQLFNYLFAFEMREICANDAFCAAL